MGQQKSSPFTRRHFLSCVALGTAGFLTRDLLYPARAMANSEGFTNDLSELEKYHIFVPYTVARNGGKQSFILRSGETCQATIPKYAQENQEIIMKGAGLEGNDITVILHTLYDRDIQIEAQVFQEIEKANFIKTANSSKQCKFVYQQVEDGQYINDVITLDLLDYLIASSKLNDDIKQRYELASTNARLVGIQQAMETALKQSTLAEADQQKLRGTFAYVRAGEPVPDFKALTDLESIIVNSTLPQEIKQTYSVASATSRAFTVDFILVQFIEGAVLDTEQKNKYLSIYQQVRAGATVSDPGILKSLDSLILTSEIPENAKVTYLLAKRQNLENQQDFVEQVNALVQDSEELTEELRKAEQRGTAVASQSVKLLRLSWVGAKTASGVGLSTLSGGAATNATLAFLGGGSVASGGLGMLGGLAVVTGGAALIGAAGLVSIALVSQMDSEDLTHLGVAIGTGTVAGAATVLAAWTTASALGVAGTLSGAAAISTTIAALGGLSVMTGGAALVASGTAFLVWSLLHSGKKRDQNLLHQLETRTYTFTEENISSSFSEFIAQTIREKFNLDRGFFAPKIPLDKLSNSLASWLSISEAEKVMALIDTSSWTETKGVAFTDNRIVWKNNSIEYQNLAELLNLTSQEMLSKPKYRESFAKLEEVVKLLNNEQGSSDWIQLLLEIGNKYSSV